MQFQSKLVLCITGSTLCVNKSKVTSSFRGIWYGLYFLAPFFFSLSLPISKGSTLAKIWGPQLLQPVSTGLMKKHKLMYLQNMNVQQSLLVKKQEMCRLDVLLS